MKKPVSDPAIDILVELRVHIARKYVTQLAAAKAWGCSAAFVSNVLKGNKLPTDVMLRDAGFKKVCAPVHYVRSAAQ